MFKWIFPVLMTRYFLRRISGLIKINYYRYLNSKRKDQMFRYTDIFLGKMRYFKLISLLLGFLFTETLENSIGRNDAESSNERYRVGELIFVDNFNHLNKRVWEHEINMNGGYNGEFQIYNNSEQNSYTKHGKLYIKPTLTAEKFGEDFLFNGTINLANCTDISGCKGCCNKTGNSSYILNPAISARLRTKESFSFKYGRFEVKAKMPNADWTWPAIWLLPKASRYGSHPKSGEIDLVESRGNEILFVNGVNIGVEQVASCLHFGPRVGVDGYRKTLYKVNTLPGLGFDNDFHIFTFDWTPEYFQFAVDGIRLGRITPDPGGFFELGGFSPNETNPWVNKADNYLMAPFDQEFYIVLNVAVGGGTFFPDNALGIYEKPWINKEPLSFLKFWNARNDWRPSWNRDRAALQIDYIKIWSLLDSLED